MKNTVRRAGVSVLLVALLGLGGCSGLDTKQQRALTGGAIGAAGGALVGALAGSAAIGAAVGGVGGALIGGLTGPSDARVNQPAAR